MDSGLRVLLSTLLCLSQSLLIGCSSEQPIRVISLTDELRRRFNTLNRLKSRQHEQTRSDDKGHTAKTRQALTDGPKLSVG